MIIRITAIQVLLVCVSISVLGTATAQPGAPAGGPYPGMGYPPSYPVGPGMGASPFAAPPGLYGNRTPSDSSSPAPYSRFGSIPSSSASSSVPPSSSAGNSASPYAPGRYAAPVDTTRMESAYRHGDFERVSREAETIEQRTRDLKQISPELPVQERLKVPLLNYQAKQGKTNIESGRDSRNEYKVGIGVEQINDVNERVNNLERMGSQGDTGNMAPRGSSRIQGEQRNRGQVPPPDQGRSSKNEGGRRKGR